jgi:nucleotide sugar dehydrogenase
MDAASLEKVQWFFDQLVERTVAVSGTREAELTKLLENTFRHVNIALVNELAMYAKDLDINVWEAIDAASTKPFGYMRFTPGPGVGGHCLPIDPSYLSWQIERRLGQTFRFVELANDVNSHMPDYVVRRVQFMLNEASRAVKGSNILVFGLAYKANTGDARETPSVPICELLVGLGARVSVVDPYVADRQFPTGSRVRPVPMPRSRAPTWCCSLSTTTTSTPIASSTRPPRSSTAATCSRATTSSTCRRAPARRLHGEPVPLADGRGHRPGRYGAAGPRR